MSAKFRLITVLLRVYPPEWRAEYGPELAEILNRRPLGIATLADVLWGGVRQRARVAEPATFCGLAAMLVIAGGLMLNIAGLPALGRVLPSFLRDSWKLFPTVVVTPLETELYVFLLFGCGCWTALRGGATSRPGLAAMKVTAVAGIPILLMAVLILAGVVDLSIATPGQAPAPLDRHTFTYTYYSAILHPPSPLAVLVAPLAKLPESWIWGALGGRFGRSILRSREARAA